jgi:hypothetical protein
MLTKKMRILINILCIDKNNKQKYLQASVPEADIKLVSVASKSCSSKPSSYLPTVKPSNIICIKEKTEKLRRYYH